MANFTDILNKPAEEVKKLPPMPVGNYICIVAGPHGTKEVNDKPVISIKLKTMQATEEVDQAALSEAGGLGKILMNDFFLVNNEGNENDWPLVNFLENTLGISKAGKTTGQMLAEAPGKQCLATVKHETYVDKNGEAQIVARIAGTAKV